MSLVTRELSVIYGSFTIGAGTDYLIDGKTTVVESYPTGSFECNVVVTGTDEANFVSNCAALEVAFRTSRQRLQVVYGTYAYPHVDWNPATGSGYNQNATISKPGSPHDTGRSRLYRVSVTAELPADLAGQAGRRRSTINLMETESRRFRCFFQAEYTVVVGSSSGQSARKQASDNYNAWVTGVLAGFGGTWEGPFDVQGAGDDTDKNITITQTWEELIFDQATGVRDDLQIRRQHLRIDRLVEAPGDSVDHGPVARLETLSVQYEAAVDKTKTQDLKTVYQSKILPFLLAQAKAFTSGNLVALVAQDPAFDPVENRLHVQLTVKVAGASSILSSLYRTDDSIDAGLDLVPAWTGDRMSKYVFQGPGAILRTITQVWRQIAGSDSAASGAGSGGGGSGGSLPHVNQGALFEFADFGPDSSFGIGNGLSVNYPGSSGGGGTVGAQDATGVKSFYPDPDGGKLKAYLLGANRTAIPLTLGRAGDPQIQVTDLVEVSRYAFLVPIPTGSTTGGGGGGAGRTATGTGAGSTASNPPAGSN